MRLCLLSLFAGFASARLLHSLPEDTYAFPKYRVTFLNGLPVLNETAERWLRDGLRGGELEFLDQPWKEDHWHAPSLREISGGEETILSQPDTPRYKLEHMKLGPKLSYICLTPPPLDGPSPPSEEPPAELTPAHSWSLLQPLSGTCLYHRQGWFTYSYCHNQEIRQFRELPPSHLPTGGYQPEEDPDWESYTLGKAPSAPDPGADLSVAEQSEIAANLELARGAGSRYLVQRWGDGSVCDKTGRKREVEVQFHCSMTMTDTILFVKEAKTCSYVLVIHTPRLCAEPGFRSRLDAREEASIRCREVVAQGSGAGQAEHTALPEADHPIRLPRRKPKPVLPEPPADTRQTPEEDKDKEKKDAQMDALRRALGALLTDGDAEDVQVFELGENGEFLLEFDIPLEDRAARRSFISDELAEALGRAGFEVRGGEHDHEEYDDEEHEREGERTRDEL